MVAIDGRSSSDGATRLHLGVDVNDWGPVIAHNYPHYVVEVVVLTAPVRLHVPEQHFVRSHYHMQKPVDGASMTGFYGLGYCSLR